MDNKTKHLQLLTDVIRRKHYSLATERTYCLWFGKFWDHALKLPRDLSREKKLESFLTSEAKRGCSASTQNQAFNAIRFYFAEVAKEPLGEVKALRAKRPEQLRFAPSREDIRGILKNVKDVNGYPTAFLTRLLYGCGLRVREPFNLRVRDVDLAGSRLIIRQGKGNKDRVVSIPCSLIEGFRAQLGIAKAMWEKDRSNGLPCKLPGLLGRKYPGYEHALAWYWVFPQHVPCIDPRDGRAVRYHAHECNLQRAVKAAAKLVGIEGVTPHHLRHSYATHALEMGANVRAVQEALGHAYLDTTMGYIHADALDVRSPLETV
ncbi:MAG: tyrosine-type recombinase/integrase [Terrimicrobiaceae bacterium]